jgi:glycosyltransferase involved in cell wall biosynthesis
MYKGLETIIDTARLLTENKFKFTWLVAGLKEEQAFVRMVKKLRAVDSFEALNIRLAGNLSAEELAENLRKADAFVQVSHIENSPNSLCEAMLVGTPVITSLAGGTLDLIQDGITGTVVQNGDPYALAGAMIELTEQPERSIRMAGAAQQAARKKHDIDRIMDQLMTAYSEIIRDHAGQNNNGRQTMVQSPVVTEAGAL